MNESDPRGVPQPMPRASDAAARLAALRADGADRFDPVRFHFLETLARRTQDQAGTVGRILDAKLAAALTAYLERLAQAPQAAPASHAPGAPLADLLRHIAQDAPDGGHDGDDGAASSLRAPTELKSIRYFRTTWSQLSAERQLTQALEGEPENAGPLNSHLLVVRALAAMRAISPDYLKRFMSYADTLLWLDAADGSSKPKPRQADGGERPKKSKSARSRAR